MVELAAALIRQTYTTPGALAHTLLQRPPSLQNEINTYTQLKAQKEHLTNQCQQLQQTYTQTYE